MFKKLLNNKKNFSIDDKNLEFEKVQYNLNLKIAKLEEQTNSFRKLTKQLETRQNVLNVMKIQIEKQKGEKDQSMLKDVEFILNQLDKDQLPEIPKSNKSQEQLNAMWDEQYKRQKEQMNDLQDEMQAANSLKKFQSEQAREDQKQEQLANFQSSMIQYLE